MAGPHRIPLSRKSLVAAVTASLVVAALIVPAAVRLPRWVEFELVLAAWWLVWTATLTGLLFRGDEVDDDTDMRFGVPDFAKWGGALLDPSGWGCLLEGFLGGAIALIVAGLLLVTLGVVVGVAYPALALLLLFSIGGMLARVANDGHGCEGRFGVALLWGTLWATLYIGPLAAVVVWGFALGNGL